MIWGGRLPTKRSKKKVAFSASMKGENSFLVMMLTLWAYDFCKCSVYFGTLRCPLFFCQFLSRSRIPHIFLTVHRCFGVFWPIPLHVLHSSVLSLLSRFLFDKATWFSGFCSEFFWRPWWSFWKPWREDDGRWGTARHRVSPERDNFDSRFCKVKRRSNWDSEPGEQSKVF